MLPLDLQEWLFNEGFEWSLDAVSIEGGDICQNILCTDSSGETIFVKYMDSPPPGFFQCEAEGLSYLAGITNVRTPKVYASGRHFLVLEYIKPMQHAPDFWEQLGHQMASIHSVSRDHFGFLNDNYCGTTLQRNTPDSDPYRFFSENRILSLAERANDRGLLNIGDLQALEAICLRLSNLVPEQAAGLLHGDLWVGNVHVSETGQPVLIDPAVYFAWPEIDLAMTSLFGGFDERFYSAYQEFRPLELGWRERLDLYNLYPLLNHILLFGSAYVSRLRESITRYS
jgi:fructosamine-3-kinase